MIYVEKRQNVLGFTLIELIVAMVVISIAITGVLLAINYATSHSADPVLRHQAIAIAESYMEEICLKEIDDPDGVDDETERADYDDVDDYNGLSDDGAANADGTDVVGLENYIVSVSVTTESFGPSGAEITEALRIDVTVTDPAGEELTLSGYRADY
jgi:MSHA pilin protein MshD